MKPAWGPQRNSITAARSAGSPGASPGTVARIRSRKAGVECGPHGGVVGARRHRVDRDPVGGVLSGQEAAQGHQSALARRIGGARESGAPEPRVHRGDVHDPAAAGGPHPGHSLARTQICASEVHVDNAPPGCGRFVLHAARAGDARIVDEHRRMSVAVTHSGERLSHRLLVGHVAGHHLDPRSRLGARAVTLRLRRQVESDDSVPRVSQPSTHRRPGSLPPRRSRRRCGCCQCLRSLPARVGPTAAHASAGRAGEGSSTSRGAPGWVIHSVHDPS